MYCTRQAEIYLFENSVNFDVVDWMFSFLDMFAYLEKILHLSSHTYKITEICITWKLLTTHKNEICKRNIRRSTALGVDLFLQEDFKCFVYFRFRKVWNWYLKHAFNPRINKLSLTILIIGHPFLVLRTSLVHCLDSHIYHASIHFRFQKLES